MTRRPSLSARRVIALIFALAPSAMPAAEALHVAIVAPPVGQPLFGDVEVVVEVEPAAEVVELELILDGEVVASATSPPFTFVVDVGEENREHRLQVRVEDRAGEVTEAELVSPKIWIDDRVEARLQQLYITVLDGEKRVLDLGESDFDIRDNGVRQDPVTFSRGDVPLAAVILVDASASMRGRRLRFALRGAAAFAELLRAGDECSVQLFSDRLLFSSAFTSDAAKLAAELESVEASGGTALVDHLYRALKQLESRQGRRVVILLSDGVDSHSTLGMQEARWLARRSRSMLYWIRVEAIDSRESRYSSWRDPDRYRSDYRMLSELVAETGGRIVTLDSIEETGEAMQEILQELREQYVIGYYPSLRHSDGSWHKVEVGVSRPALEVRARRGYIDY